jgi:hypothetical protein
MCVFIRNHTVGQDVNISVASKYFNQIALYLFMKFQVQTPPVLSDPSSFAWSDRTTSVFV